MTVDTTKRLFIGVGYRPNEAVRKLLVELQEDARESAADLRPVTEQNLHVTLKFLGMVRESEIILVRQVMDQVIARFEAFTLRLQGFGCFRQALWLGIGDCLELKELAGSLDRALGVIGVERERKTYFPHLTVARLRQDARSCVSGFLEQYSRQEWDTFKVDSVHLYQSETRQEGARYTRLFSVPLVQDSKKGEAITHG